MAKDTERRREYMRQRWQDPEVRERNREAQRRYRENHPERVREARQKYADSHPEYRERRRERSRERGREYREDPDGKAKRKAYQRAYYQRPEVREREKQRAKRRREWSKAYKQRRHRLVTYGITDEDWTRMCADQDGLCAICRRRSIECVDHDHATGLIRQLLCQRCNQGMGYFDDDVEVMQAAIDYLLRHRAAGDRPDTDSP